MIPRFHAGFFLYCSMRAFLYSIAGVWLLSEYARSWHAPVWYVGNLPGNYNGCCLPPFGVFISDKHKGNAALLAHELEHWDQFRALGMVGYYTRYCDEMQQYGYDLAPMEIAARLAAGETVQAAFNYTSAVRSGSARTVYNPDFRR